MHTENVENAGHSDKSEHAVRMIRNGIALLRRHTGCEITLDVLNQEVVDLRLEQAVKQNNSAPAEHDGFELYVIEGGRQ